jgi:hypothetical protein
MTEGTATETMGLQIEFPTETTEELNNRIVNRVKKVFVAEDPASQLSELQTLKQGLITEDLPVGDPLENWKTDVTLKNEVGVIAQDVVHRWNDLKKQPAIKSEDLGRFLKGKAALTEQLSQINDDTAQRLENEGIMPKTIEQVDTGFKAMFNEAINKGDKKILEDLRELFPRRFDLSAEATRNQIAEQIKTGKGTIENGREYLLKIPGFEKDEQGRAVYKPISKLTK